MFDRSHYEDVLVVRVHNIVPPEVWGKRYDEINKFEKKLVDDGTTIIKVAMFVSLDEQKLRLSQRLERPDKYWKYNPGDVDERLLWPEYQEAYQALLERTSTDYAPWHVVPCDRKWYSRLAILELLIEALEGLNLSWPPADFDVEAEKKRLKGLSASTPSVDIDGFGDFRHIPSLGNRRPPSAPYHVEEIIVGSEALLRGRARQSCARST